jgi:hypothetical protein
MEEASLEIPGVEAAKVVKKECAACWAYAADYQECRFASPTVQGWPKVGPEKWCVRFRTAAEMVKAAKKKPRVTWAGVMRLIETQPDINVLRADFERVIQKEYGVSRYVADVKIQELVRRGRLEYVDDEMGVKIPTPAARGVRGPGIKHHFETYAPILWKTYHDERPGMFTELLAACQDIAPISGASFNKMLKRALEADQVVKTAGGLYWVRRIKDAPED